MCLCVRIVLLRLCVSMRVLAKSAAIARPGGLGPAQERVLCVSADDAAVTTATDSSSPPPSPQLAHAPPCLL